MLPTNSIFAILTLLQRELPYNLGGAIFVCCIVQCVHCRKHFFAYYRAMKFFDQILSQVEIPCICKLLI